MPCERAAAIIDFHGRLSIKLSWRRFQSVSQRRRSFERNASRRAFYAGRAAGPQCDVVEAPPAARTWVSFGFRHASTVERRHRSARTLQRGFAFIFHRQTIISLIGRRAAGR